MKHFRIVALLFGLLPIAAYAGTCAAPSPLPSNYKVQDASTCGAEPGGINMGGAVYAHPSQVYSFVASGEPGEIKLGAGAKNVEMSLTTSCTAAPLDVGVPGAKGVSLKGLTKGTTYLLIVSTDPSLPKTGDKPFCNTFTLGDSSAK